MRRLFRCWRKPTLHRWRAFLHPSVPARSSTFRTDVAYHRPPRAVATPRALSAAAISCSDVAPARLTWRMIGSTFAACWSAAAVIDATASARASGAGRARVLVGTPLVGARSRDGCDACEGRHKACPYGSLDHAGWWSEWQDLNLRPPRPERGALPGCATLRRRQGSLITAACAARKRKRAGVDRGSLRRYGPPAVGRLLMEHDLFPKTGTHFSNIML
jgi:hypothetical protein